MGKTSKTNTTSRTKMKPDLVMVLRSYGLNGLKKTKAGVSPAVKRGTLIKSG